MTLETDTLVQPEEVVEQNTNVDIDNTDVKEESSKDEIDILEDNVNSMNDDEFMEFMESDSLDYTKFKETKKNKADTTEEVKEPEETKVVEKDKTAEDAKPTDIDFKAVYETIFKPFKANGKEIQPKTVDDVISLMQMGANYTKKMQLMAPMRKTVETLNKASIDEKELNFLIDVYKGNKGAIKALLNKHKVDPLDLTDEENTDYVPNSNIASDADVEFAQILEEVEPSLPKIVDIINKQWDSKSKTLVLKDPKLVLALHQEIEMGRFDDVQKRLELEKTFGRYNNVSDLEAYIDIVSKLEAKQGTTTNSNNNNNNNVKSVPNTTFHNQSTKPVPDKTKAAPVRTRHGNHGSTLTVSDIFSMPEEEFMKLSQRDLI